MADRTVRFILSGDSAGAVRAMSETAAASEATGTKIGDEIDKGTTKAGGALNKLAVLGGNFGLPFTSSLGKIGDKLEETSTKGQKFGAAISEVGKVALLGGAAAAVAFGAEAIKLGSSLEDSQAQLKAAVVASGESMTAWQGPIAQAQAKMADLGFTNTQVNQALAVSVVSTQNVGKSLSIMGLAADLARSKHVDLTTATTALDKALTGNLRPLTQMGISLPIAASSALKLQTASDAVAVAQAKVNAILQAVPDAANAASSAHAAYESAIDKVTVAQAKLAQQHQASTVILDALSQRLGGQAAAAANTFSGQIDVLKAHAEDFGASVGTKLIPIIQDAAGWIVKNEGFVKDLGIAIGVTLVAAIGVFVGTTIAGMSLVDAVLGGIPLLVGAIVLGAIELDKHWGQVMGDLKNWAEDAVNFVIGYIDNLIGAFDDVAGKIPFFGHSLKIPLIPLLAISGAADAATNSLTKLHNILGSGGGTPGVSSPAVLAAGGSSSSYSDKALTNSAANVNNSATALTNAANAQLVNAQKQEAATAAGLSAAKGAAAATTKAATTAESESKNLAAEALAEEKKRTALIDSDTKAGNAALNTQLTLTTSTSLTSLNTGLNATHNAALVKLENTLELTHDKNLKTLVVTLNKTHAEALANWVAQQKAATASGDLQNAQNAAGITADQQTVSNDTANLVGLTSDALAVGQAQLAVDQQKLAQDQQDAILQANVNAATTATAKATAQAAMDNYDAQQVANAANLSAALSAATNRQSLVSSGAVPALAAGGLVTRPTLALVGESGPEMVVPLSNISTQQPGPLPAMMGANSGHTVNFMPGSIVSNANPNQIATEIAWTLKTA